MGEWGWVTALDWEGSQGSRVPLRSGPVWRHGCGLVRSGVIAYLVRLSLTGGIALLHKVHEAGFTGGPGPGLHREHSHWVCYLGYVSGWFKLPKGREGLDAQDICIFWMVSKLHVFAW